MALPELVQQWEKQKQAFAAIVKTELAQYLQEFFAKHAEVKFIGWAQYFPYYGNQRDGQFCVSDMAVGLPKIKGVSYRYDSAAEGYDWMDLSEAKPELYMAIREIHDSLYTILDHLQIIYGDRLEVKVYRSGRTKLEEYYRKIE